MTLCAFVVLLASCRQEVKEEISRRQNFDAGWKFHYGDTIGVPDNSFDDSQWRRLNLPHDWSVETPFSKESEGGIATGQTMGGTGWYRKRFTLLPEQKGKLLQLYFEGVYMEAEVWMNGQKIAYHPYGYTSFFCDITNYCHPPGAENVLTVKVGNQGKNSRWYSGSGIYRHIWMITTDKLHLDTWGLFITTPEVSEEKAKIQLSANIINKAEEQEDIEIHIQIKDSSNVTVGERFIHASEVKAGEKRTVQQEIEIIKPALWSTDAPALYLATVSIQSEKTVRDELSTSFGIRSISFSSQQGFLLNGKSMKLKGGCVHHDNGLLGAASIDRAEEKKVELLKANGFNAVRCAHNPPAEKFLEACDRLGILVIDETFDQWQKPKNAQDYHRFFDEWHEADITSMVLRDRNHPSIIMWSIGNEIQERADSSGIEIAQELKSIIRRYDTTRPITAAINDFWDNPDLKWKNSERAFSTLDIGGYNYMWWEYENDIKKYPSRIIYGSESTAMERAINWDLVEKHPSVIGDFIWTAIDYLGESGIGHALTVKNGDKEPPMFLDYPWFNAWCGDIDICGDKKMQSLFRDVLWNESKIELVVHTPIPDTQHEKVSYWGWPEEYAHWNWSGYENQPMKIKVFTRYPAVRLYLDGKLLEEKTVPANNNSKYTVEFQVNYHPGELKATGIEDGKEKESVIITTTGKPVKIRLTADRSLLNTFGNDLSYIKIELIDKDNHVVPDKDCKVKLSISGVAEIIASGNACPADMESFRSLTPKTYFGKALVILRPTGKSGSAILKVEADGLPSETLELKIQ
jgi:hypothetical protein